MENKTISQIYNEIIAEKINQEQLNGLQPEIDNAQTLLTDLNSTSKVAFWRLICWIIAFAIWLHQQNVLNGKSEIETILNNKEYGTLPWYENKAFDFQYGDEIIWINGKAQYPSIDATKKIIKRASASQADNGYILLKVAKIVGTTVQKLSETELAAFNNYFFNQKIKPAGPHLTIDSRDPDVCKFLFDIYYNPLVLKSTGELLDTPGSYPVQDAIENHLNQLGIKDFGGTLVLSKLTDDIQTARGVVDVKLNEAWAKYASVPYVQFDVKYTSVAGYMIIDAEASWSSQLNYIAYD